MPICPDCFSESVSSFDGGKNQRRRKRKNRRRRGNGTASGTETDTSLTNIPNAVNDSADNRPGGGYGGPPRGYRGGSVGRNYPPQSYQEGGSGRGGHIPGSTRRHSNPANVHPTGRRGSRGSNQYHQNDNRNDAVRDSRRGSSSRQLGENRSNLSGYAKPPPSANSNVTNNDAGSQGDQKDFGKENGNTKVSSANIQLKGENDNRQLSPPKGQREGGRGRARGRGGGTSGSTSGGDSNRVDHNANPQVSNTASKKTVNKNNNPKETLVNGQ